ncbi:MAG: hypothetical protein WCT04_23755 [Planctomycetota bacterium]
MAICRTVAKGRLSFAPTGQHEIAQGNALGIEARIIEALKGRHDAPNNTLAMLH